jgi:pyridoxine kinase
MNYKRILTIQDISCVGQCSLTVALPILSACGIEAAILPSAVLSTHTAGFNGYTFRDLSDDIPSIKEHWVSAGIKFDAIYTGYLGSERQVDLVIDIVKSTLTSGGKFFVDPAMADNGRLYPGFDEAYAKAMLRLSTFADYVIPNVTEACFLTGIEYKNEITPEYTDALISGLVEKGCKNIILTGIGYKPGKTGIAVYEDGKTSYYEHELMPKSCHGTGDIYASAFVGAMTRGKNAYEAAKIAADYTLDCIKDSIDDKEHWYGVHFEGSLGKLIDYLK